MKEKIYHQVILTTCPDRETAKTIANNLIAEKLAACVSIIDGIVSVYRWQGEIVEDNEVQLLIKTTSDNFIRLRNKIKQIHPYDMPEIIALNIQQGDMHYLNWITASTK